MILSAPKKFKYTTSESEEINQSIGHILQGSKTSPWAPPIDMAAFHNGTSWETSKTLPITGYPLGPGGYGNLEFRRLLYTRNNETETVSEAAQRGDMDSMGDAEGEGTA